MGADRVGSGLRHVDGPKADSPSSSKRALPGRGPAPSPRAGTRRGAAAFDARVRPRQPDRAPPDGMLAGAADPRGSHRHRRRLSTCLYTTPCPDLREYGLPCASTRTSSAPCPCPTPATRPSRPRHGGMATATSSPATTTCSTGPERPTAWATTPCGSPSTTSSTRATRCCRTSSCSGMHSAARTERPAVRADVQRRAPVAPVAPGRGLRPR